MLLSIVESSDYRAWPEKKQKKVCRQIINETLEVIGPVCGPNISNMRNRGAKKANGQWIFFKDQDCHINREELFSYVKEISQTENAPAVVGGFYQQKKSSFLQKVYGKIQHRWVENGVCEKRGNFLEANHLLGGAFLVRKSVFEKVGGFSEKIGWAGEENDFCIKAQNQGFITGVSHRIQVQHQNKMDLLGFIKRAWWQSFNKGFYQLYFSKKPQERVSYFKGPLKELLPTLVFFGVSSFALVFGSSLAPFFNRWGK